MVGGLTRPTRSTHELVTLLGVMALGACRPAAPAPRAPLRAHAHEPRTNTDASSVLENDRVARPFPSFWATHPRVDTSSACDAARERAILERGPARAPDRAAAWARLAATCSIEWNDVATGRPDLVGMRATIDFARALHDAGYPAACRAELSNLLTPYPGGLDSLEHSATGVGDSVAALGGRARRLDATCAAGLERQLADFRPVGCGGARTTSCYELGADDGDPSPCGEVAWVDSTGSETTLHATAGPLVDPSFCCGLDAVATATRAGTRFLRIGSAGIARVCGGGTAARALDAIYAIHGRGLSLVVDYSLALH